MVSQESEEKDRSEEVLGEPETLDKALALYPEGFFEIFKRDGLGGLMISVVDDLENIDPDAVFEAGGVTYHSGVWTAIALIGASLDPEKKHTPTIHHEITHAVEQVTEIKTGKQIDYDEGLSLCPEGFDYLEDHDAYAADERDDQNSLDRGEDPYFIEAYGKIMPQEDRATLIAGLFTHARFFGMTASEIYSMPHLKPKYDKFAQYIEPVFGGAYREQIESLKMK